MKDIFEKMSVYLESLERRIAVQETLVQQLTADKATLSARLAAAETRLAAAESQLVGSHTSMQELRLRLDEIASTAAAPQPATPADTDEPEVEIELIEDDSTDEIETEADIVAAAETDNIEETKEEQKTETEDEREEEIKGEPKAEPKTEIKGEPKAEIKEEPKAEEKSTRFVQTSLFGSPVQDIRKAISLGDRFLFQRELFGGKGELMQQTLDRINSLSTFSEAEKYINDTFSWDRELPSYELFMNVLRRRFGD